MTSGDFEYGDIVIYQGERYKVFCAMNGWITIFPATISPLGIRDVLYDSTTVRAKDVEKEAEHAL